MTASRFVRLAFGSLAACAPKPPERLPTANAVAPTPEVAATFARETRAPRPDLDIAGLVPDFHELLRWPLTAMSHPTLEPHFAIAALFADPGVDWIQLCERGAQNRSLGGRYVDEMQYLRGWCHVLRHDVDTALGELAPLLHSSVSGMSDAVRIDLANVIVDSGDAERAEHWLSRHDIDEPEALDTLGASFVEVGKEPDALQINTRLLGMSRRETEEVKCRRFAKQIALGSQTVRADYFAVLETAATKPKVPDPVCVELYHSVKCWRDPANDCGDYLADQKLEYRYTYILWLWYRWPKYDAAYGTWVKVADNARAALALVGAEKALLVALDAAERTNATCSDAMMAVIDGAIGDAVASNETRHALAGFRDRCAKSQTDAAARAEAERRAEAAVAARIAADERAQRLHRLYDNKPIKFICGERGPCAKEKPRAAPAPPRP